MADATRRPLAGSLGPVPGSDPAPAARATGHAATRHSARRAAPFARKAG